MPAYKYRAKKAPGEYIESVIYAQSQKEALERIDELGYEEVEIGDVVAPISDLEKRVYVRVNNKVYVKYKVYKGNTDELDKVDFEPEVAGITEDISAGGLCFRTQDYLSIGTVIELTLELPEGRSIKCLARVVRVEAKLASKDYDVAVYFLDLSNTERVRLNRYVLEEF